ncbi:hypothetical protein [Marinovum sp.]|uniref:hypothetical protein n=1 Tax=Marinovum sp. TaxID=2024839 RepID=UPI002B268B0A|nr:hypothetical protein [Marinovum sp.]
MSELLLGHASDHLLDDDLEGLLEGGHGCLKLGLRFIGQRDFGLVRFIPRCLMSLPNFSNSREFTFAVERLMDIGSRDLPSQFRHQGFARLDDLFVGVNGFAH